MGISCKQVDPTRLKIKEIIAEKEQTRKQKGSKKGRESVRNN